MSVQMANTNLMHLTDDTFASQVADSDRPVLADFHGDWYPPWRGVSKEARSELAKTYGRGVLSGPRHDGFSLSMKGARMLVLSRKVSQEIIIGGGITIRVVSIRGNKVRLGIEAPKEIPVNRREVQEAIARHNGHGEAAANTT